jgi:hypothetical protein
MGYSSTAIAGSLNSQQIFLEEIYGDDSTTQPRPPVRKLGATSYRAGRFAASPKFPVLAAREFFLLEKARECRLRHRRLLVRLRRTKAAVPRP